MLIKKIALIILFFPLSTKAQDYSFGLSKEDEQFLFSVKVIDEFIERFDDKPSSFIRKELKKQKIGAELSRSKLLVSLFNWANPQFRTDSQARRFYNQVLAPEKPSYIYFNDSTWYAVTQCLFDYKGQEIQIPLALHIKYDKQRGSKWMISAIGDHPVLSSGAVDPLVMDRKNRSGKNYISPVSYAVDFLDFNRIFSDSMRQEDFLDPSLLNTERGQRFVLLIKQGQLKFSFVKKTSFHFYQIAGWIFVVDEFDREGRNSGWLINEVYEVTPEEKERYRERLPQIKI